MSTLMAYWKPFWKTWYHANWRFSRNRRDYFTNGSPKRCYVVSVVHRMIVDFADTVSSKCPKPQENALVQIWPLDLTSRQ